MNNLNAEQRAVVTAPAYQKTLVISSAASGKTKTLVARIRHLLDSGIPAEGIVAVTFTNAAADEMLKRLGRPQGLFIGTIHSLANRYLLMNGVDTKKYLENERFDELFELILQHPDCVRPVEHLLTDESQDQTSEQFTFLLDMIKPKGWTIFADHRQSIYGFRDANPQNILDLAYDKDVKVYNLNNNYRNGKNILSYAKRIISKLGYDYSDRSIPNYTDDGMVIEYTGSIEGLIKKIEDDGNWKDWFILCRYNSQVDTWMRMLKAKEVPCESFKRAGMSNDDLSAKMEANTVKVLTIHTAKGLEAKNVIVQGTSFNGAEEIRVSYVAATRAKEKLYWMMPNKTRSYRSRATSGTINWE